MNLNLPEVRKACLSGICLYILFIVSTPGWAESRPLPEPLTLEFALSLADTLHPDLQAAAADVQQAKAGVLLSESLTGFNTSLEARARWVDPPSVARDQSSDDHRIGLILRKNLYDFGRSGNSLAAAQQDVKAQQNLYMDARQRRRIEIMRRYFDVVLADLQFYRYNEEMSVVFVALDRTKDRQELGQASDIDVLEKEAAYQRIRRLRYYSQNQQHATRARLARALNRPGELSETVARPDLPQLEQKLPEVEKLQSLAMTNNAMLQAKRSQLSAAQAKVMAARAGAKPKLYGEVGAYDYTREMGSYDKWRAGVTLEVPLSTGGSVDAAVAREQAKVYRLQAELRRTELDIKQAVLESWLQLDTLRVQREEMRAQMEYRELYLDRSRALYEQEVKTDLGDAMVRTSEAEHNAVQTDFEIALVWASLDALTGRMKLESK